MLSWETLRAKVIFVMRLYLSKRPRAKSGHTYLKGNLKKWPPVVLSLLVCNVQGGYPLISVIFDYMGCLSHCWW